ncbi:Viral A-type inclusion protein [Trypanosoma theileri]|uniref:Viral A-type inclusion protein n=1 Tax=Trypanosoma theileri TaxID=67003 RepID=A0A1X0NQ72_9TRYP|nr:Viral A-type inclusion protein [Trypanosoma theileri]ORC86866.1 Viral A-type inclusion protein [Trypanosoma theileri]
MTTVVSETADRLLPHLIAENASLKTILGTPEHERVMQEVLREQLQRFFDDAKHTLEKALSQDVVVNNDNNNNNSNNNNDGGNEEEEEKEGEEEVKGKKVGGGGGVHRVTALAEALRVLGSQNEELLRQMNDIQTQRVVMLNGEIESLGRERDELQSRVVQLEEEAAAAAITTTKTETTETSGLEESGNNKVIPLLSELRSLRASDALLRQQMREMQERSERAAVETDKLAKDGIQASLKLPQLLEQVDQLRTSLHQVEMERDIFRMQVQEMEERENVQHSLREKQLQDELMLTNTTMQTLFTRTAALETREAEAQTVVTAHLKTIEELENTIKTLQARETAADERLASKRQRLEREIFDDPDSIRRELVTFWRDGREELQQLREEVQQLRAKERLLRTTQEKLTQMERTRSTVTSRLVTLADEVERVREENRSLRAQYVGLEVERDQLCKSLADALATHMNEDELLHCCEVIRDAAAKSAAASSSVVADPQAIQQAMRHSQELKNEVAQLTKQKEKLHRYIALREERVAALITREALQPTGNDFTHSNSNSNNNNNSSEMRLTTTTTSGPDGSVLQVVKWAEASVNDALTNMEEEATTESHLRRRETFASMQQRLTASEQQLEVYKKQLEEVTAARDAAQEQLLATQEEARTTLTARETAMTELLSSNTSLMQSVDALRSESHRLRECHDAAMSFAQNMSTAFVGLQELLSSEVNFAAALHHALREERAEVVELTRRTAEAWDAHEGEVQSVLHAVERMSNYIQETAEQQQRTQTLEDLAHLRRLTTSVEEQEERLKGMQESFTESCRKFAEGLAHRIAEAQKRGEVIWEKRTAVLQQERQHLQTQLGAEKDILARIERSLVLAPIVQESVPLTSSTAAVTALSSDGSEGVHQVIEAVNQLLAATTSQQQTGGVTVTAKDGQEEEEQQQQPEEEENEKEKEEEEQHVAVDEEEERLGDTVQGALGDEEGVEENMAEENEEPTEST